MMWNPSNFSPLVCHHPLLSRRNKRRRFRLQKNWKKKISFLKWCVCILIPNWCYPWDNFIFFLKFAGEKNKKQIHVQHLCRWWRRRSEKKTGGFLLLALAVRLCTRLRCVPINTVWKSPWFQPPLSLLPFLLVHGHTHKQRVKEKDFYFWHPRGH